MEKTNLHYSTKNIPIASKIEAVIRRMRWKAIFFEPDDKQEDKKIETYGLKTTSTPQQVPELIDFEKELISIVRKLKFKKKTNHFQSKLKEDIEKINGSDKVYVNEAILNNSITSTYKKSNNDLILPLCMLCNRHVLQNAHLLLL